MSARFYVVSVADCEELSSDHLGPVSTYMASCNGGCKNFNTKDAKWFKIDAAGYDSGKKQWASQVLINSKSPSIQSYRVVNLSSHYECGIADGNSWTSTIPASLTSGEYVGCYVQ